MKQFDFNRPKKFANQIAIIGAQTNITDSLGSYMMGLNAIIRNNKIGKLSLPNYKLGYYNSTAQFDEYVASPEYKTSKQDPGVCFGVQHYMDEDTKANN